jgi:hypothetical protein
VKPPRSVYVSPFTYSVQEVLGLPDSGNMDADRLRILVQKDQPLMSKRDTALHELIHATLSQGMSHRLKEIDKDLEEELVAHLAPRILAMLRDNPEFVKYLTEEGS